MKRPRPAPRAPEEETRMVAGMNIWSYILKRVLLMIPTLFGVVAITFAVIQFVPGGPVEQAMLEMKRARGRG